MSDSFANSAGTPVLEALVATITENKAYLSEVDGAIGDGDHGINMAKGFKLTKERMSGDESLSDGLKLLGKTLVEEIGGAMGPLYGSVFKAMARACKDVEQVDAEVFEQMLASAYEKIQDLGEAEVGDKTLVDTLDPALAAFREAREAGKGFADALSAMAEAAEKGKESTKELVAKKGRAARLGERSKGALDAGATSCWLILDSMAGSMRKLLAQ
jgi:phosphoenolpyruvate---glycerone phosphotransferase subunit DhaL